MSDNIAEDGSFINSIVGEGTRFKGELDLNGLLRIDGDYSGTIRTPGKVLVGKNGRAECSIFAGTVVVGGVVKGDIHSTEKVIVLSTGMILGNVTTPRLIVEEGVILNGECTVHVGTKGAEPAAHRSASSFEVPDTAQDTVPTSGQATPTPGSPGSGGTEPYEPSEGESGKPEAEKTELHEETKEVSAWNG
jgi:cytoskeletal protein CcmA (bactofilin family)